MLEHPNDRILFLSPRHAIKEQMYEYIVRFIGGDTRPIEEIQREYKSLKQAAKQYIPNIECMLYQTILGYEENLDAMRGDGGDGHQRVGAGVRRQRDVSSTWIPRITRKPKRK